MAISLSQIQAEMDAATLASAVHGAAVSTPEQRISLAAGIAKVLSNNGAETWAARLRRLRAAATNNNPIESPQLIGSVPWITGTVYAAGAVVSNAGNVYRAAAGGTAGATAPVQLVGSQSDGTITWWWIGLQTAPVVSALSTTHNASYTKSYGVGPANFVDNVAPFRWRGGVPMVSPHGSDVVLRSTNVAPEAGDLGGTLAGWNSSQTFILEGTACEVNTFDGSTNRLALIINGRYIDSLITFANLGNAFFTIDFTNVKAQNGIDAATGYQRNTITVDVHGQQDFKGVNCLPTGTLSYPTMPDNFTAAVIGDSQTGAGWPTPANQQSVFPWQMMHLMGLPDMQNCAIGGTGFVANAAGAAPNYISHAIADLQFQNAFRPIGLIFVQISANDHDPTGLLPIAGLAAGSLQFFQALRAAFPSVPIVAIGCVTGGGVALSVNQSIEAVTAAQIATLQAAGDTMLFYVPAALDPGGAWIVGTGNAGAPNGTGNADVDIQSDGLHMSEAGQSLYARKTMTGFLNQIATIP